MATRKSPTKKEQVSSSKARTQKPRRGVAASKPSGKKEAASFEQVYEIVKKIPRGKVLTYGHISKRMNGRLSAAAVGWALNGLGSEKTKANGYDSKTVPWHRVLNSKGTISTREESPLEGSDGGSVTMQQFMLEREGVVFGHDGSIDLAKYLWRIAVDKEG